MREEHMFREGKETREGGRRPHPLLRETSSLVRFFTRTRSALSDSLSSSSWTHTHTQPQNSTQPSAVS